MSTGFRKHSEIREVIAVLLLSYTLLQPEGRRECFGRYSTFNYLNSDFS